MRVVPPVTGTASVVTPVLADMFGYQFELAPMIMGVASCVIVRVYMGAKAKTREGWVVDIAITLLTVLFTVGFIITTRPNLMMALILGTGLGAIGAGLIHYAEKKTRAALGDEIDTSPQGSAGRALRRAYGKPTQGRPPADQIAALIELDREP